jgi:hypothetical protein
MSNVEGDAIVRLVGMVLSDSMQRAMSNWLLSHARVSADPTMLLALQ